MEIAHDAVVAFSKSWGLFYLVGFSLCVVAYAYWPGNRKAFTHAKMSVLDDDDRPLGDRPLGNKPLGPEA